MLTEFKISNNIYHLRKKIQLIQTELNELGDPASNIPELMHRLNIDPVKWNHITSNFESTFLFK